MKVCSLTFVLGMPMDLALDLGLDLQASTACDFHFFVRVNSSCRPFTYIRIYLLGNRVTLGLVALVLEESLCNFCSPVLVLGLPVDLALKECSYILKALGDVIVVISLYTSLVDFVYV